MNSLLENRCSKRVFSDKEVPADLLQKMLKIAIHAPNTGNMQWYSVVFTTAKDNKSDLERAHFSQPAAVNAKVLATFCLDINRFEKWCEISNATPGFDNFQSFIAAFIDATIIAQQFATVAELNGLGTCILGTTTYNAPEIGALLGLPKKVVPVTTVALGYRLDDMVPTERLPVDAVCHFGKYHDYSAEQIKDLYYDTDNSVDNAKFIQENGKETLAQVFTDVRYPKTNNELFSVKYLDYIREQGFPI